MNGMQKITYQLLEELDDLCGRHGLRYYLGPTTAATAMLFNRFDKNLICPDVMMAVDDIKILLHVLETSMPEGRSVEHMGNSKNFIGFQVSYIDENSTYLQLSRGTDVSKCGARVNILPIRKATKGIGGKVLRVLETGWESNGFRFTKRINWKTVIATGSVRLAMIFGKRNVSRWLFQRFMNHYGKPSDAVVVKEPKKKSILLPADLFENGETIMFAGRAFPTPARCDEFLQIYYGEYWREKFSNRIVNHMDTVMLPAMSYHDFIQKSASNGQDINRYFREYRWSIIKGIILLPSLRRRAKAILIAKRSGDRLHLYEELSKKREIIHNLYNHQNYDELRQVFAEHERTTLFYLSKKLGFCASDEFFQIQCALFRHYGRNDIVDKLKTLVPKEHYKPIVQ